MYQNVQKQLFFFFFAFLGEKLAKLKVNINK